MENCIIQGELSRNRPVEGEDAIVHGTIVRRSSASGPPPRLKRQKSAHAISSRHKFKSSESQGFYQLVDSLTHMHEQQGAALETIRDENGKLRAQLREYKDRAGRQSIHGADTESGDWESRSQKTVKSCEKSSSPQPQPAPNGMLGVLPGCPSQEAESDHCVEPAVGHTLTVGTKSSEQSECNRLLNPLVEWAPCESVDEVILPGIPHLMEKTTSIPAASSPGRKSALKSSDERTEERSNPKLAFDLEEAMQEIEDVDAHEGEDITPVHAHGHGHHFFLHNRTLTEDLYTFTIYKTWELEASRLQKQLSRNRSKVSWTAYKNSTHMLGRDAWAMRFIILPSSPRRVAWDLCGMVLLAYDMIFIPLNALHPGDLTFIDVMDWITLLFWTTDILVSCVTGYVDKGVTITHPRKILRHYIRGWFVLDLFVVVPDWVFTLIELFSGARNQQGNLGKFLRTLRAARTVRLLRLAKLKHVMSLIRDRIDSEYMFIVSNVQKMMMLLLLVNHFIGCGWYWVGDISSENGLPSWTQRFAGDSFTNRYFTALHWSLSQFTPGSMDVQPKNAPERIYAVCCLISGLVMMSWFISSITASMAQMRSLQGERPRQMWLLRRFLRQNLVSNHLTFRIQRYMEYACSQSESVVSESKITIIHMLSDQLLDELHYTVKFGCLHAHPLFEWAISFSSKTMYRLCRRTLSKQSLAPNDVLFQNGKACGNMYFVTHGKVRYVKGDEQTYEQLDPEDWLCEPAMWTRWVHIGEARSVKESDLVQISVSAFGKEMLQDVPMHLKLSEYAKLYVKWLNEELLDDLSDVSVGYEQRPIVSGMLDKIAQDEKLAKRISVVVQSAASSAGSRKLNPFSSNKAA